VRCYYPLQAWQLESGEVVFAERGNIRRELKLPCGQCIGCRLKRSAEWALRCVHEAQMHERNVFVTLTYDKEHLPESGSLDYRHFQLFIKRLRKAGHKLRYFMAGEYGEENWRPHFHACLFGVGFDDRVLYRRLASGFDLYTSPSLERYWEHGFSSLGEVSFESAAYVARYVVKKVTGDRAVDHYRRVSADTGEIIDFVPEFCHMSLKPGIGMPWFEKYHSDVFPADRVWHDGRKLRVPRFYDKLLEKLSDEMHEDALCARELKEFNVADLTPERLDVRAQVARARLSFKKRTLE